MKRLVSLAVAAAWLSPVTALAQSLDFLDQRVTVDVAADPLHVDVELRVRATERADALAFFVPSIELVSIDVGGEALDVEPDETYPDFVLWATLPEPLEEGDEAVVHMVLDGDPRCSAPGQGSVCTRRDDETMLLPSSTEMAWAFVDLFGSDPFTASVTVRAPADHLVAAGQGAARSIVDGDDGTRTWTFGADVPTEQLAVYTRAAASVTVDGPLPVLGVTNDEDDRLALMEGLAQTAADLLPIHEARYGDLGVDEFHLLTFSDRTAFAGMGLFGNVLLFDAILDAPYEYLREQGIAHETAHSWWGGLASAEAYEEAGFFNEAFAEFSAWAALGELRGDDVRTSGVRMSAVWYMLRRPDLGDDIAPLDPAVLESDLYVFVTYHKASVFLRTLEEAAGPEAFTRALARFAARGAGGLSTDALAEDVLAESGWDPTDTIDQWLRAPGFPEVTAGLAEGGGALALDVQGDFSFRLPVVLHRADGTREEVVVDAAEGASDAALPDGAPPVRIELDPRWTLVRLVRPALPGDVSLDGVVDAIDLVDVALRQGGELPEERRVDGAYDPLYDVDGDERIDRSDLTAIAGG